MNIINLTPHTINILRLGAACPEELLAIPPSGIEARLATERKEVNNIDFANGVDFSHPNDGLGGIAFYKTEFGKPSGLPDQKEDTIYIVSSMFRSGFDRDDLWVPGELVRDSDGKPIGCLGLSR